MPESLSLELSLPSMMLIASFPKFADFLLVIGDRTVITWHIEKTSP
jgi:hypothetical protein